MATASTTASSGSTTAAKPKATRKKPNAADEVKTASGTGSPKAVTAATPSTKAKKTQKEPAEDKSIAERWGKDLTAAGWTAIPNAVFEHSQDLGLKTAHIVVILHLAGYWWRKGNDPFPSKATLAQKMGVQPRTVQRAIAELETMGYIERTQRFGKSGGNMSNSYSFNGLIKKARVYAKQMIAEREAKAVASSRKKPARAPKSV
ncbi:helix-turn-helix domain-containing protein [Pseudomonas fulva]|uniref:helix-turn-helix domain-containing protein n=1 Tax=Pseudomonas fulva TaxID=47880 RepID=UPI0018A95251|nr:helix-turn-helix domain-containing protein [Pseudomonas fulva]MBF8776270.1 helix-turn-helix domain-containing protein [Pseudomonas fulva]